VQVSTRIAQHNGGVSESTANSSAGQGIFCAAVPPASQRSMGHCRVITTYTGCFACTRTACPAQQSVRYEVTNSVSPHPQGLWV
jgi:hypothetical protein